MQKEEAEGRRPRPFGVQPAPTVYPDEHEFADPYSYIQRLRPLGERYGIVKVVPPRSWRPPFCLDRDTFEFQCRLQRVGCLGIMTRAKSDWLTRLYRFHFLNDRRISLQPLVDTPDGPIPVDYYQLEQLVRSLGGIDAVEGPAWYRFVHRVGTTDGAQSLVHLYRLVVEPFEAYVVTVTSDPAFSDAVPEDSANGESDSESDSDLDSHLGSDAESVTDSDATLDDACECGSEATHKCGNCEQWMHYDCVKFALGKTSGSWFCPRCICQPSHFLFEDGKTYTLREFETMANAFKQKYLESLPTDRRSWSGTATVEHEFWRLVNDLNTTLEVEYGAEIRCDEKGSGFPTSGQQSSYAEHPWNLNNLPLSKESLFRHLRSPISGVTVPWAYVGMMFSAFCWHTEDHLCYSINYHHVGEPKTWYGIPASHARKFEEVSRRLAPESFKKHPDLLTQRSTLVPPQVLEQQGVAVHGADQQQGEFIITFPDAYHAGFNHGFNVNEAVNYVPPDWLPMGASALKLYRRTKHEPTFSHEELLLRVASAERNEALRRLVGRYLGTLVARERHLRSELRGHKLASLPRRAITRKRLEASLDNPGYRCSECKCLPFFSRVTLEAGDVRHVCLECALSQNLVPPQHRAYFDVCFDDRDLRELARKAVH